MANPGETSPTRHGRGAGGALKVFVSYRRGDSAASARLIAEGLERRLGAGTVFFDVEQLAPGSLWKRKIAQAIAESDVVIVVIGPRWIGLADERGQRLMLDPEDEDVVREEIDAAVRARALIIPVLVD